MILWLLFFNVLFHTGIELYRLGPSSFPGKNIVFFFILFAILHNWKRGWKFYDKGR